MRCISLRGVEVHNLKQVDLDLPYGKLIVLCGLSGSGKTSLALDTLYAEGQRRYIESFSAYTRQFLQRLDKPKARRIDGIPPAVAVTHRSTSRPVLSLWGRSTIGTATETLEHLRLLFAKIGQVHCLDCGQEVRRDTPQDAAETLQQLPAGTRYMISYAVGFSPKDNLEELAALLREDGFLRAIVQDHVVSLADESLDVVLKKCKPVPDKIYALVDRLSAGSAKDDRIRDSLETALSQGDGTCYAFVDIEQNEPSARRGIAYPLDGRRWLRIGFSSHLSCEDCQRAYQEPEPRLYSFNSPLGACPECEGFGNLVDIDMDLVVPDKSKTIRDGAIAPWNTPSYAHELEELLALTGDYEIPVDVPFSQLSPEHLRLIHEGVSERNFGGLSGFFAWLERRKYKMHLRVFLSRWRSYHICPACGGSRLRPEALANKIGGRNIADVSRMKICDALEFFQNIELTSWQRTVGRTMLAQVQSRLYYLGAVGLGYLALERTLRTLSGGEAQRVALTSALGSSLVNMLYVLDEPSVGLHPHDVDRLMAAIVVLRDRGNTVVVVEHEESIIRMADQVIEIGPDAGERGGRIVFQGTPDEMAACPDSITGDYLSGRRGSGLLRKVRPTNFGWIRLAGARGNNLKNLTVEFPLGVLCLVTGVSGSGKSTLVQDTLYPALCRRMNHSAPKPLDFDEVLGYGQLDEVILVDQSPIGRSPRSNPVTYVKAFDAIRAVFADTIDSRTHNYTAGHFSFNVDGGRCNHCHGDGSIEIDMQLLSDVTMTCSQCDGKRYRREILDVRYRGRNIADVLEMTVREAFTFFRGSPKVQTRLKRLIDVGLGYIRLGQPAKTLSGGEAQRLKLASYMASTKRGRSLFILDEPTTGMHLADIVQLLDCFEALLSVGHSLIVVEHNVPLMKAADFLIDLGPGAADLGGEVVARGTPEEVARNEKSVTGQFLAKAFQQEIHEQTA